MTATDRIANLAGRELDTELAEKVMGFVWKRSAWTFGSPARHARVLIHPTVAAAYRDSDLQGDEVDAKAIERVPHYSAQIAAAWQIVERLRAAGWELWLHFEARGSQWIADFVANDSVLQLPTEFIDSGESLGETAPLAICRAALELQQLEPALFARPQ